VLIEQSRAIARKRLPKWLWITAAIVLCVIAAGAAVLAMRWPFTQETVIEALQEASGRRVEIRAFSRSYFPPGCTALGIRFLRHKHPQLTPIITIEKLTVEGSITGLTGNTKRLAAVRVAGMRMVVPAIHKGGEQTVFLNAGPGGKSLNVSKITADGAVLEFMRQDRDQKPYVLKIDRLRVSNIGAGQAMSYRATLTNTEPPGVIQAEGKFGPWNPTDVGATPVSGTYTYNDIELRHFEGIHGVAQARGQFSGPLAKIQTHGDVNVAAFRVDGSDHTLPLATTFEASVNGVNGDVLLRPAVARFRRTRVEVRGPIAARPGETSKSASFDVNVPEGRVDDLLYLFTRGEPGLSGQVKASGRFLWPPGPRKFLEKIRVLLAFGMGASHFTSAATQESINRISESAEGEKKKEQDSDARIILSKLRGTIQLRDGVATISNGTFEVPGAEASVHGAYNLLNQRVDLHGTLDTQGHLSDTQTGFKALVLKAVSPLFKKRGSVKMVPFDITGSYGNTKVGIDWKTDLARLK